MMIQIHDFSSFAISDQPQGDAYKAWLSTLGNANHVGVQEFVPARDTAWGLPFDLWQLSLGIVRGDSVECFDGHSRSFRPWSQQEGWLTFLSTDTPQGKVFPTRVIKIVAGITKESVFSHRPLYEPLYQNCYIYHYLVEYGVSHHKAFGLLSRTYPQHLSESVRHGVLFKCYSSEYEPQEVEGAKFLYSCPVPD